MASIEEWKDAKYALSCGSKIEDEEESGTDEETNGDGDTAREDEDSSRSRSSSNANTMNGSSQPFLDEGSLRLPEAATLLRPLPDYPPPTRHERFEHALQLRLTQLALIEHVDGPENAGTKWLDVFGWVAARKGLGEERKSHIPFSMMRFYLIDDFLFYFAGRPPSVEPPSEHPSEPLRPITLQPLNLNRKELPNMIDGATDIPINLVPPSPSPSAKSSFIMNEKSEGQENNKGKKVQQILKDRVHKGQAHIHTISRKIGGKHGLRIKRSASMPGMSNQAHFIRNFL